MANRQLYTVSKLTQRKLQVNKSYSSRTFHRRTVILIGLLLASTLASAATYQLRMSQPGIAAAPVEMPVPPVEGPRTYATFANISATNFGSGWGALTNGNLTVEAIAPAGGNAYPIAMSSICKSSGSWYWEVNMASNAGSYPILRVGYGASGSNTSKAYAELYFSSAFVGSTAFPAARDNQGKSGVYGVALNATAKTISVFWNGVLQGSGTYADQGPACAYAGNQQYSIGGTSRATANFGQSPFSYGPPAGYNAGLYD